MVVDEQRLGSPLSFVVARAGTDGIDRTAIRLDLRMNLGIAVHFAGGGLQHLGSAPLGHAQHVDGPHHGGLHRLDGVVLVVPGRRGAGEVVDLVHLQKNRLRHVVPDELKCTVAKMLKVREIPGQEVVDTHHGTATIEERLAEMRAEEPCGASDDDSQYATPR